MIFTAGAQCLQIWRSFLKRLHSHVPARWCNLYWNRFAALFPHQAAPVEEQLCSTGSSVSLRAQEPLILLVPVIGMLPFCRESLQLCTYQLSALPKINYEIHMLPSCRLSLELCMHLDCHNSDGPS